MTDNIMNQKDSYLWNSDEEDELFYQKITSKSTNKSKNSLFNNYEDDEDDEDDNNFNRINLNNIKGIDSRSSKQLLFDDEQDISDDLEDIQIINYKKLYENEKNLRIELEQKIVKLEQQIMKLSLSHNDNSIEIKSSQWHDLVQQNKDKSSRKSVENSNMNTKLKPSQSSNNSLNWDDDDELDEINKLLTTDDTSVAAMSDDNKNFEIEERIKKLRIRQSQQNRLRKHMRRSQLKSTVTDIHSKDGMYIDSSLSSMQFQKKSLETWSDENDSDSERKSIVEEMHCVQIPAAEINLESEIEDSVLKWARSRVSIVHMLSTVGEVFHGKLPDLGNDWYELKIPTDNFSEIRKAYLKIIRYCHPDKQSSTESQQVRIQSMMVFAALSDAFNYFKSQFD